MWEYREISTSALAKDIAYMTSDGWEYVDRVLEGFASSGLPTWSILFRRPKSTGTKQEVVVTAKSSNDWAVKWPGIGY